MHALDQRSLFESETMRHQNFIRFEKVEENERIFGQASLRDMTLSPM
jgi:hypothetical protein